MRLVQQLPNELVIEAFKLLNLVDLLKCRRVSYVTADQDFIRPRLNFVTGRFVLENND
jgi:hypothetical protein